jgi:hypothetical protein
MPKAIMIIDDGPDDSPTGTFKIVFLGGLDKESFAHRLMVALQDVAIKLTEAGPEDCRLEMMTEDEFASLIAQVENGAEDAKH